MCSTPNGACLAVSRDGIARMSNGNGKELWRHRGAKPIARVNQKRMEKHRLSEKCAEFSDEIIAFWARTFRNEKLPIILRMKASDRIMDRAFGKVPIAMQLDADVREQAVRKIV